MEFTHRLHLTTRILVTFLALAVPGTGSAVAADAPHTTLPMKPPGMVAYERTMVEWAYGLFTEAGLTLQAVRISFHESSEPCEGNMGTLRHGDDGTRLIRVCADHDKPAVRDRWRRKTLVHELAHAWEQTSLDDATRGDFADLRGLGNWNDRSGPWHERATEHTAEVVTWALLDFGSGFAALPDHGCDQFRQAYRALTGDAPLNGLTDSCS